MIEQRLAELADLIAAINTDPELEGLVTEALASTDLNDAELRGKHAGAVGEVLDEVRTLRKRLAVVEASLESTVARVMPRKEMYLPDGRLMERRSGSKRTRWEVRRVLSAVVDPLTITPNGERDESATELLSLALDKIEAVHRFDHFRAGALKAEGLDPDNYATVEPGRSSIQITGDAPRGD